MQALNVPQITFRKAKNKRGQLYTIRPNRTANGFSKHYADKNVPDHMLKLVVRGTYDELAITRFDLIWITIMHPADPTYTKRVLILKKNKKKFIARIPMALRGTDTFINKK